MNQWRSPRDVDSPAATGSSAPQKEWSIARTLRLRRRRYPHTSHKGERAATIDGKGNPTRRHNHASFSPNVLDFIDSYLG
jgi:hypothetical protein